ncbi:DUF2187 family protein [Oceanobacillus halophilus]|uniref:DUF2187 domain-containing protein n=1 Tax=Oceanobacillus halophilus TaxID=930130 RepID=A0A495ABR4_9BACI|nr:DUF2187 family protein [Oceanobacillus halophilus]RKQ35856.1 DUF2187 domain-containing protein [Oceanobacillus halophilus]
MEQYVQVSPLHFRNILLLLHTEKVINVENVRKSEFDVFQVDEHKAEPGDIIQFQRENVILEGTVLPSHGENSIIVDLSSMPIEDLEMFNHGYSNTVVAHSKYKILEKRS